ncbi:SAM-dependent methyltransferase [Pseudonocardia hierapolitana]|nr:SAM-dependent methyltransferase [Pseudonocardia hierapolitana]
MEPAEIDTTVPRFLDGMQLLDPGVVSCSRRRPVVSGEGEPAEVYLFGGVGRIG